MTLFNPEFGLRLQVLIQAMRLLATQDGPILEYDEETCDAMWTLMQWVVPEVIRLVKSPELFSCGNVYRLFVQQAFDCLVSLKATAYVFEQGEKKSDCQMDILQTTDYLHKFRAYQFSVDDYEHPWNHFFVRETHDSPPSGSIGSNLSHCSHVHEWRSSSQYHVGTLLP